MKTISENLLSIVIPTKNRANTIKFSIETIFQQNYTNFKIIISDNNSKDGTEEIIKKFNDKRIEYFYHKDDLTMKENWEFGLSKIEDGFVTIMGDDDGFCPNSFFMINEIINTKKCNLVNWATTSYFWPTNKVENNSSVNFRYYNKDIQNIRSKDKIKKILGMNEIYSEGPMIYNSFLNIDLVKKIKKKQNNIFFLNEIPDISSLFSILLNSNSYYRLNFPIGIAGASKNSNGSNFKNNKNTFKEVKENLSMFNIHENIVPSFYFATTFPYKDFMNIYPNFIKKYPINYYKLIPRVMDELKYYDRKNYEKFYKSFCNFLKKDFFQFTYFEKVKIFFTNFKIERIDYFNSRSINFFEKKPSNIFEVSILIHNIYRKKNIKDNQKKISLVKFLKYFGFYGLAYFLKNLFIIIKVLRNTKQT